MAEAAEKWEAAKHQETEIKAILEVTGGVLKAWFRKTGKRTYKDRIGYAEMSRTQLDTEKVKAELGDRLPEFQRRIFYQQLSLLQ